MTQEEALNILKLGHNTFLTGSAGTGKTYVLNQFIEYLKLSEIKFAITASTGIAATHIGGITIHSFSGIGVKEIIKKSDLEIMMQNENLYKKWNKIKVLIIDEISMLHKDFLNNLDLVAKTFKRNNLPFGGIQMVFCGDFFQLPPVVRRDVLLKQGGPDFLNKKIRGGFENESQTTPNSSSTEERNRTSEYCFNSNAWKEAKPVICYLTENFRQEDNTLLNILNAIRDNSEDVYESLEALNETKENVLQNPVKLWTHNVDVDKINLYFYNQIGSEVEVEFSMKMFGKEKYLQSLKQSILTTEILKLKVGTKIMFIKNSLNGEYQNGTLGIVTKIKKGEYPEVELKNGKKIIVTEESWQINADDGRLLAEINQLPLRYAWAITIHKSQGMTLDEAEIDLSKGFGYGMGYVALSRVKSLSGLKLHGLNNQALKVSNEVLQFDKNLKQRSELATEKIKKYSKKALQEMQEKIRIKMGGRKILLTKVELDVTNKNEHEFKSTQEKTLLLILDGKSLEEIAEIRDIKIDSVIDHLHDLFVVKNTEIETLQNTLKNKYDFEKIKSEIQKQANFLLQEFIKKNKINKKIINEIKKDLQASEKIRPIYDKWKEKYSELKYIYLKLINFM